MNWISKDYRLPRQHEIVLFYGRKISGDLRFYHNTHYGYWRYYGKEIEWRDSEGFIYQDVTHWMKLPDAPGNVVIRGNVNGSETIEFYDNNVAVV